MHDSIYFSAYQAVSLPADKSGEVKQVFQDCAQSQSVELAEIPKHSDLTQVIYIFSCINIYIMLYKYIRN